MNKQIQQQKIFQDPKLKLKYDVMNKLGSGCFGVIYKAINRQTKKQCALKIQFIKKDKDGDIKKSNLMNQIFILNKLKGVGGVPQIFSTGRWNHGYYMEMQLFSSSLYEQRKKQFTQAQIYIIIVQLIKILKNIHQRGVIHQDLKPQNIMRNNEGSFIIIDFGLSISNEKNTKGKRGFVGTPRYASLAAHKGQIQQPKDDIQSLLYVIASLYMKKAPWFQLKGPIQNRLQKIQKTKRRYCLDWLHQCGKPFENAYQYVSKLTPNQIIDYSCLLNMFQDSRRHYIVKTLKFQSPLSKNNRRKSGTDAENHLIKIPTINIHLIDAKNFKNQQNLKFQTHKLQNSSQNNRSHNYSQMAQDDGLMEMIQMLTQTIFSSFQQQNTSTEDTCQINSVCSKQPSIHNISKLYVINFKNPFEI